MGNTKGLKSMINEKGITAPAPFKTTGREIIDTPFFGKGVKPIETYKGMFAVGYDGSKSSLRFSDWIGGAKHYGSAPIDKAGKVIRKIPLDDEALSIYKKKWFSSAYKKIPKDELNTLVKRSKIQQRLEKTWRLGYKAAAAKYIYDEINEDNEGGK